MVQRKEVEKSTFDEEELTNDKEFDEFSELLDDEAW
jgi:hypothetical protein